MFIIFWKLIILHYHIIIVIKFDYFNILMNSDDIVNFGKDYTLKDFEREPLERRLEILATSVNLIPRALSLLSLKPKKVYTSGQELLKDLLRYLGISFEEFIREKESYRWYLPVSQSTYWVYVSTDIKGKGTMTKINLVTRIQITPEKVGYTLTTFGEIMKPFVAYILKKCTEYEINPWELFGHTQKRGEERSPVNIIRILKYIYENEKVFINDIATNLGLSSSSINRYLSRLKKLGLVDYKFVTTSYGEAKVYRVNRDKLEDTLRCLEDEKCRKHTKYNYIPVNTIRFIIDYIIRNNKSIITTKELLEYLKVSYHSIYKAIRWLIDREVLYLELPIGRLSIVRITERGKKIYENIVKPILEVAENPDNIIKYGAELDYEDRWRLLEIYSGHRYLYGERERDIIALLQKERDGLTIREIANRTRFNIITVQRILARLKKRGIVKRNERGKWYIADPNYL